MCAHGWVALMYESEPPGSWSSSEGMLLLPCSYSNMSYSSVVAAGQSTLSIPLQLLQLAVATVVQCHDETYGLSPSEQWRKRNIFRGGGGWRGAKSLFPIFSQHEMLFPSRFPGRNLHFDFGTPKTKFCGFQKWKAKNKKKKEKEKKKKKGGSSAYFNTFLPFNFPPSLLQFSFFYSPISLFPLPTFSR